MSREQPPRKPPEREATARQRMESVLRHGIFPAKEISVLAGVSEKRVASELEHLAKSLRARGERLVVEPAACRDCGHVFAKRERLSAPSRCPVCKSGRVRPPEFTIG
ncbi:transcriptional regulator [Desulfohalovibrio reitneri]|uniref:transcriptional regulator n=1 Tax=Desulfohalovibrio reitneri TaxID=1307759 RepID=UPI0004A7611C|nr:hypothetical protein [Desulfohalovibrio reitneri]